jgi:hypothetical protein
MGIWGARVDANDDAADWLIELTEAPSLRLLRDAFVGAQHQDYVEVDDGARAVIAAEVLAQLIGVPAKRPILRKTDALAIGANLPALEAGEVLELATGALAAVRRVGGDDSELCELLGERAAWLRAWRAAMKDLERRLARASAKPRALRPASAPPPPRPRKVEPGAIVAIQIQKRAIAYAKVFRGLHLGVYQLVSPDPVPVEQVMSRPIAFYGIVIDKPITSGRWRVIGNQPFTDEEAAWGPPMATGVIPQLNEYSCLQITHKGSLVRRCTREEAAGMDIAAVHNEESFVEMLVDRLIYDRHDNYRISPPPSDRLSSHGE